jgi:hypothetical protein
LGKRESTAPEDPKARRATRIGRPFAICWWNEGYFFLLFFDFFADFFAGLAVFSWPASFLRGFRSGQLR